MDGVYRRGKAGLGSHCKLPSAEEVHVSTPLFNFQNWGVKEDFIGHQIGIGLYTLFK